MAAETLEALRVATIGSHKSGDLEAALKGYRRYLQEKPKDAAMWANLGALYRATGCYELGRIVQKRAYGIAPNHRIVLSNYANISSDLGDYETSIRLRKLYLQHCPADRATHHAMIGRCYRGLGQYRKAINYLTPKVAEFPDEPEIKLQLAFAQFGVGDYGAAFRTNDVRWEAGEIRLTKTPFKTWEDGDPIAGKTILVTPEQGFGDMVLMCRFIPLIAQKGAKVHLVAKKPLRRLLEGIDGVDWLGEAARPSHPVDYRVSLMDLPKLVFDLDDRGHAPGPASLNIPEDSAARAKATTARHNTMFKVGVVWSGSTTYRGNTFRSFSHRMFLPLAELPNVQLFSLYKGPLLEAFETDGSSAIIIDTASTDRDFADCAATMKEMDLIITSDTATAHIAGSLGLPTWVVLHWDAFWVYRHAGETTEWYPSMRLFRQPAPQDWDSAFEAVRSALEEKVSAHG